MWAKFVFREIVPPERLVYVNAVSDEQGNTVRSFFSETWPQEILNTLTLTEQDGQTTLTLRGGPLNASEAELQSFASMLNNVQQGFAGAIERLAEYLDQA